MVFIYLFTVYFCMQTHVISSFIIVYESWGSTAGAMCRIDVLWSCKAGMVAGWVDPQEFSKAGRTVALNEMVCYGFVSSLSLFIDVYWYHRPLGSNCRAWVLQDREWSVTPAVDSMLWHFRLCGPISWNWKSMIIWSRKASTTASIWRDDTETCFKFDYCLLLWTARFSVLARQGGHWVRKTIDFLHLGSTWLAPQNGSFQTRKHDLQ